MADGGIAEGGKPALVRFEAGEQALRRRAGRRRAQPRHPAERILRAARALRLRQDHAAAPARRLRDADRRPHSARRRGHQRRAAAPPAGQHDVPELCAVSASDGRGQYCLRLAPGRRRPARARRARRRDARAHAPARLREAAGRPALRRPAPARGAGALADQAPARAAARRAARRPRQEAARRDPVRADAIAAQARHQLRHRHPRPGRGDDRRRPHRADERGPADPGRPAGGDLRAAAIRAGSPISSAR